MQPSPRSGHAGLSGEPPAEVRVIVIADARRATRPRRARPDGRKMIGIGGALAAMGASALLAIGLLNGGHPRASAGNARARAPGAIGVAAAYGYPLRCLSVAIALHDPRFARADFDRATACGRFAGSATAIFRRMRGAWVPVLEATSYACPVRSLPVRVQVELGVCLQPTPSHARRARGRRRVSAATNTSSTAS